MEIDDKLHSGQIYDPEDPQILAKQTKAMMPMYEYNATLPTETAKRQTLLTKMFAKVGEGSYIEPPFHANWGGRHVELGAHVYANFNLTIVDDTYVYIGDQYNLPIHIGKNCWLGAGVIVVPGVTIGDNSVIGAGAVITKDIPANVVAVGTPARVLRKISDHDRKYYHGQLEIDPELLK